VRPFRYERPADIAGAVALVATTPQAVFLGGGTNLVDLMRLGVAEPEMLVDVTGLAPDRVEETAQGGLRIGAGVRNSDLAAHPEVRSRYPALTEALVNGASGQLRIQATVGVELFTQAAELELSAARPLRDNAYKVPVARNLIVRMLLELAERQ
jgi:xanthine dehydrogenase YagS FAD-binding subunit